MTGEQPLDSKTGRFRDDRLDTARKGRCRGVHPLRDGVVKRRWPPLDDRRCGIRRRHKGNADAVYDLAIHPIHLGLGAGAGVEPAFNGLIDWYAKYVSRHQNDGVEARLVSMHRVDTPWDAWETHPHGSGVVLCIAGSMTLHQDKPDGLSHTVTHGAGQYAINEPGTRRTADVEQTATALFITAGLGTQHRPRFRHVCLPRQ